MGKNNMFKNLYSYILKQVKNIDQFGEPVKLTIKGDTTYKTHCGGICTALFAILVLTFAIIRLVVFMRKQNTNLKTFKEFQDFKGDAYAHFIGK